MKGIAGLYGAIVATLLFLAVNVLGSRVLSGTRIDLTEENLFTLSEGSKNIARGLDEPIHLYLYYSEASGRELPDAKEYYRRVLDVLREYERSAGGKLVLELVDPEPFSEEEDEAVAEGIAAIPTRPDPLYFGLVGTNATDDRQVIPFFGEVQGGSVDFRRRERFLEYDLSRLIYSLAHPDKKVVGVLSSLPLEGGPGNPMLGQQAQPKWRFLDQLAFFFDLRMLSPADDALPEDLDALLVVHPREFSDTLLYAVDQFVLDGGKLVALVDPHCEVDFSQANPQNPMSMGASRASDMNRLFQAWGFEVVPNKIAGDERNALSVQVPTGPNSAERADYVAWLDLSGERLSSEDPVTSLLETVLILSGGSIRQVEGATTTLEPLLTTSEDSMEIDAGNMMFRPDPQGLLDRFVSGKKELTLMARVTGEATSAFPEGLGAGTDGEGHLAASNGPIHVLVIADADLLHDNSWLERSLFGLTKTRDNCDLVLNALENLTGGSDLISIRARGKYSRPFDRLEEIRRRAERQFKDKENALMEKERLANEEIQRLQRERDPNDPASRVFLTDDQVDQLEKAQEARRATRKELREVRHSMDREIESLGWKLKAINILGVPLAVVVVACGLGFWRVTRRGTR